MNQRYTKRAFLGALLGIVIGVPLALAIERMGGAGPSVATAIAAGIGSFVGVVISGLLLLRRR